MSVKLTRPITIPRRKHHAGPVGALIGVLYWKTLDWCEP